MRCHAEGTTCTLRARRVSTSAKHSLRSLTRCTWAKRCKLQLRGTEVAVRSVLRQELCVQRDLLGAPMQLLIFCVQHAILMALHWCKLPMVVRLRAWQSAHGSWSSVAMRLRERTASWRPSRRRRRTS